MLFQPKQFKLQTAYNHEQVFKILQENTLNSPLSMMENQKYFEGTIYNNYFHFKKTISGQNSFNPIISGQFLPLDHNKTVIEFDLKINPFIAYTLIFWVLISSVIFILALFIASLKGIGIALTLLLLPIIVALVGIKMILPNIIKTFELLFQTKVQEVENKDISD